MNKLKKSIKFILELYSFLSWTFLLGWSAYNVLTFLSDGLTIPLPEWALWYTIPGFFLGWIFLAELLK